MTKTDEYKKGDWIVHAYYGVGQVKGIDRKAIDGDKKKYYRVKTKNMTYWLPIDSADVDHIRPVASKNLFTRSLKLIRKKPQKMAKDYKVREKEIRAAFSACSLKSLAELIRDLYGRRVTKGKMSQRDVDILEKAKNHFINEYAVATATDQGEAKQVLENALAQSVSSIS